MARLSLLADLGYRDEVWAERAVAQDSWVVRVSGDDGHQATYRFGDDRKTVWLDLLTTYPDPAAEIPRMVVSRAGWGRWKFGRLIDAWSACGYRTCRIAEAVGNVRTPDWTGYYVWPRFGFDGRMTWDQHERLPGRYKGSRDLQTLFALPGGSHVWRRFGGKIKDLTFDLHHRSRNRRLFDGRT